MDPSRARSCWRHHLGQLFHWKPKACVPECSPQPRASRHGAPGQGPAVAGTTTATAAAATGTDAPRHIDVFPCGAVLAVGRSVRAGRVDVLPSNAIDAIGGLVRARHINVLACCTRSTRSTSRRSSRRSRASTSPTTCSVPTMERHTAIARENSRGPRSGGSTCAMVLLPSGKQSWLFPSARFLELPKGRVNQKVNRTVSFNFFGAD